MNKLKITICCLMLIGCVDKNTPEYTAKEYLLSLKNHDWERAKIYSDPNLDQILDIHKALNTDFGFTEIKNIKCVIDGNIAKCTYCCSSDSLLGTRLRMIKSGGHWLVQAEE
jgi:hypothetical protein